MFEFADDSVCLACNQNRLTFEPPSLYCTCCGQRIKRNQVNATGASRGFSASVFRFPHQQHWRQADETMQRLCSAALCSAQPTV